MSTLLQSLDIDFRKALAISVVFHLVLLGLFAVVRLGWMEEVPEWVEMSFVSARPPSGQPAAAARSEVPTARPPDRVEEAQAREPSEVQQPSLDEVLVPKRRMLEEEEPALPVRASGKLSPKESARVLSPGTSVRDRPVGPPPVGGAEVARKPDALSPDVGLGGKELPRLSEDLGGGVQVPFEIEGEVAERTILKKVIPEYPQGLQREAAVRIRFTVLPNGLVGEMVPLQKADPVLERVSLEALRLWRFNSLDPEDEQVAQQGIITFRYVLQ